MLLFDIRFANAADCGASQCRDLNYREHFHCLDCNSRVFVKKEEMIRHFKWHKKRDESLQHGFMRYSPCDDCSKRFPSCAHNRKQTHYHCLKRGCDKVPHPVVPDIILTPISLSFSVTSALRMYRCMQTTTEKTRLSFRRVSRDFVRRKTVSRTSVPFRDKKQLISTGKRRKEDLFVLLLRKIHSTASTDSSTRHFAICVSRFYCFLVGETIATSRSKTRLIWVSCSF